MYMVLQRHSRWTMKSKNFRWWRTNYFVWASFHRKNLPSWRPGKRHQPGLNNHGNFQKSRHATRLIFIQSTKLHALVHVGNLQRRIDIMRNRIQRSSTQWSSTEARAQQRWRINPGTITPTYTKNRKNIIKGWLTVTITNISSVALADCAQMLDAFPEDGEWAIVKHLLHLKFSRRYISFSVSIQL